MDDRIASAYTWLQHGFGLLPTQPDSKAVVRGFGVNRDILREPVKLRYWFEERRANLTVVCLESESLSRVILDFDLIDVYKAWRDKYPKAALSYSERTPGGGMHVYFKYYKSDNISRFIPVPGLELKRAALAWPSTVAGKPYQVIGGGILTVHLGEILEGFATMKPDILPAAGAAAGAGRGGLIDQAKQAWPILPYLAKFQPGLTLAGGGRWLTGLCPWHADKSPSLWVDTERNTWGCHGCPAHGDVINWHARLTGKTCAEAARELRSMAGG